MSWTLACMCFTLLVVALCPPDLFFFLSQLKGAGALPLIGHVKDLSVAS